MMAVTDVKAEPKSRPVLFSGPMIRAILDGRKRVTRRVIKGVFRASFDGPPSFDADCIKDWDGGPSRLDIAPDDWEICPYGVPGNTLWCRETWQKSGLGWGNGIPMGKLHYRATDNGEWKDYWGGWKPSIFMPRWASRITLEITGVRVERLHDITEQDAIAEGVRPMKDGSGTWVGSEGPGRLVTPWPTAREAFRDLWESINGKSSWDRNDWLWCLSFRRLEPA